MRLISADKLKDGMVVAKTIYLPTGTIVINRGVQLKERYILKIKELGVSHIYIEDPILSSIVISDIVKEETRQESIKLVKEVMDSLDFTNTIPLDEIKDMVNTIIDELLKSNEIIINLSEIRSVDFYTFGHSVNVSVLSIVTGICMGYSMESLIDLGIGSILHDIGKVRVDESILNKPDKLTEIEFQEIKKHTIYGYEILKSNYGVSEAACNIALSHHERFDGNGYPNRKHGEEIHQMARIVSITDVYDALTTDRVYKKRIKVHEAIEYLISMGGHQFDYNIVRRFLNNIAVFPIGTGVILNNGEIGFVVKVRKDFPTRPLVKVTHNSNKKKLKKPYDLDLIRNNTIVILDTTDDI